ncbi:cytidine deaminase [Laetiporus sulphureus 93-53]|uniref:Cytidine deaminase n=1 Tax=Laetiporus sulphureus 93-53 TaxID=1314785 RepID=A0A165BGA9_9APHY|nr:cytidine deaminase [Laetiporus sulphureus 93-53]KZT01004.1 cytidine deaminase [Laetiporus sulphureus 93-53]
MATLEAAKTWSTSVPDRERLIRAAFEAKEYAYCKYSNFRVGAALLSADGTIIKGANVENASYGGTICAERTAIVKAVSEGIKAFVALAVVTDVPSPISPCGICRQVLREFCALNMPVLLVPANYDALAAEGRPGGGVLVSSIEELLPHSFGPEHLELARRS